MSLSILLHLDLGLWLLNLHLLDLVLRGSLNLIAMAEPLQMMNRILQCGLQIVQNQVLAMVLQARICLHHSSSVEPRSALTGSSLATCAVLAPASGATHASRATICCPQLLFL